MYNKKLLAAYVVNQTKVSDVSDELKWMTAFAVQINITETLGTTALEIAAEAISAANDTVTSAAHGLATGTKVAATTSDTLPGGLSATDYFVIVVDANTLKLATNLANANAGTAVDITDAGVGNLILTPAALAGGSYTVKGSVDGTNFVSLGTGYTANITANTSVLMNYPTPGFRVIRVDFAATAGQYKAEVWMSAVECE